MFNMCYTPNSNGTSFTVVSPFKYTDIHRIRIEQEPLSIVTVCVDESIGTVEWDSVGAVQCVSDSIESA